MHSDASTADDPATASDGKSKSLVSRAKKRVETRERVSRVRLKKDQSPPAKRQRSHSSASMSRGSCNVSTNPRKRVWCLPGYRNTRLNLARNATEVWCTISRSGCTRELRARLILPWFEACLPPLRHAPASLLARTRRLRRVSRGLMFLHVLSHRLLVPRSYSTDRKSWIARGGWTSFGRALLPCAGSTRSPRCPHRRAQPFL